MLYNVNNVWKSKFVIYAVGYINLWNTKQKNKSPFHVEHKTRKMYVYTKILTRTQYVRIKKEVELCISGMIVEEIPTTQGKAWTQFKSSDIDDYVLLGRLMELIKM